MIFKLFIIILSLGSIINLFSQDSTNLKWDLEVQHAKPIARSILDAQVANLNFQSFTLFNKIFSKNLNSQIRSVVDSFAILEIKKIELKKILSTRPKYISLTIPSYNNQDIEILLIRHSIVDDASIIKTASGKIINSNEITSLHYWGIIKGRRNSTVAISLFENNVMGLICDGFGNIVLGDLKGLDQFIIYNDKSLKYKNNFECGTKEDGVTTPIIQNSTPNSINCVRFRWEIDYNIVDGTGSVMGAINFGMGIFNQSQLIYANDNINITLSEMKIWDIPSPYNGLKSSQWLKSFQDNSEEFNSDLSNLISYAPSAGGIAAKINGLCSSEWDNKKCFSGVSDTYKNVPLYSWNVAVVTHEQGHLLGSYHTHACVWNGNNTAIDGCAPAVGYKYEGDCSNAPVPKAGTIMSYCHLLNIGIDFNLGFGPQPSNLIINKINESVCLSPCTFCTAATMNDNCTGKDSASILEVFSKCNFTYGTTCNATPSMFSGSGCSQSGFNKNIRDVWYSFTATCTDEIISVQSGINFDAVIEIYDSPCGIQLGSCANLTKTGEIETNYASGLILGITYFIRVYDYAENQFAGLEGATDFKICVTSQTCFPNLVVDYKSGISKLDYSYKHISLNLDIVNNGTTYSGQKCIIKYYLSKDSIISMEDFYIGYTPLKNLGPGEHTTKGFGVDPCEILPAIQNGYYYVGYILDAYNDIYEMDEIDNSLAFPMYPKYKLDCCRANFAQVTLITNGPQCEEVTIKRINDKLPGITWYWQGYNYCTTNMVNSDTSIILKLPFYFLIRAYDNASKCWANNCYGIAPLVYGKPSKPGTLTSNSPQCDTIKIFRAGAPDTEVIWYWQDSVSGTNMNLGSGATFTVTQSGTYYLRAYNTERMCWSDSSSSIEVILKEKPGVPPTPIVESTHCNYTNLYYSANPPTNIDWYWQNSKCDSLKNISYEPIFSAKLTGTYYLRAYDNINGCWSQECSEQSVIVSQSPQLLPLIYSDDIIIISPLEKSDQIQWYFNLSSSPELNDSLLCVGNGYYHCVITNKEGCSTSSDTFFLDSCPLIKGEYINEVIIYPNPAHDILKIEGNGFKNRNIDIVVINTLGQKLKSEKIQVYAHSFKIDLDLNGLIDGIYFIEVLTEKNHKVYKFEKL